jgi:hypothetical protein
VADSADLRTWLRDQCADYRFDVGGVFQRDSDVSQWPLTAASPAELEERLSAGGHLLPLPKEPAALANVLEVSIVNFLTLRALALPGAKVRPGTERGYPDLEIGGAAFGGQFHAVDVKAARRAASRRQTQSRPGRGRRVRDASGILRLLAQVPVQGQCPGAESAAAPADIDAG